MSLRSDGARVRAALVEAAVAGLRELTPADLVSAVGTREVARRAGVSPSVLFHHFGSVGGFADAVVAHLFEPSPPAAPAAAEVARRRASPGRDAPLDEVLQLYREGFDAVTSDADTRLRLGLWALGGRAVDGAYRRYLEDVDERTLAAWLPLVRSWGRVLREPLTPRDLLRAHAGLALGHAVRRLVDPASVPRERHAALSAAMLLGVLRAPTDQRTLDDRLAEINYYPASGRATAPLSGRTRARILRAAGELFSSRGYESTTMEQVARLAGLARSTVASHFPTKASLGSALFRQQATDMLATSDLVPGGPVDRLLAHLEAVAVLTGTHRQHAPAYLAELVCDDPHVDGAADVLRATTTRLVEGLAIARLLRSRLGIAETADLVLVATMSRVLGRLADRPDDVAALVVDLVTEPVVETSP